MKACDAKQFCCTEVCTQVEAANIFLRLHDTPLHLLIKPDRIVAHSIGSHPSVCDLKLEVDPLTCSSISHKVNQGISLRFQLQSKTDPINSNDPAKSRFDSNSIFKGRNRLCCSCRCKSCGINLLSQRKLKFTCGLQLPSSDINDLSDSWTCCDHSNLGSTCVKSQCHADKIYQDESQFAFPYNAICSGNVRIVLKELGKNNIQCARCYSTLGKITNLGHHHDRYCLFYKCSVSLEVETLEEDLHRPTSHSSIMVEDILCGNVIYNVKMKEIYKFVICDERQSPFVLMQVLTIDGCLGYHGFRKMQPSTHEDLPSLKSVITMCGGGTYELLESFSYDSGAGIHRADCLSNEKLGSHAIKLLYTLSSSAVCRALSETWMTNPDVKILTLSNTACLEAILLLTQRTLMMPLRHKSPNGFLSGFLKVTGKDQKPV